MFDSSDEKNEMATSESGNPYINVSVSIAGFPAVDIYVTGELDREPLVLFDTAIEQLRLLREMWLTRPLTTNIAPLDPETAAKLREHLGKLR